MATALLLLPDLAMIALGVLLSRGGTWPRSFWDGLERLVYFLLFPVLLFQTILRAPLDVGREWPMLASSLGGTAAGIAVGALAALALRPPHVLFASGVQCAFRFNSYVAFALAQRLGGDAGLASCALIAGVTVPLCNIAAVYPLARHAGSRFLAAIARNPLVLATIAGLAGNLAGLTLPEAVSATLSRLGAAAIALGLIAVGAGLQFRGPEADLPSSDRRRRLALAAWFTATKLVVVPATAVALAAWLMLPHEDARIVAMFGAMPTAASSYILAARMGGDGPYVAFLITASTLASVIALPLWLLAVA